MDRAPDVVVKVSGSLYDLPDLGPRLRCWLDGLGTEAVIVVPGGGPTADVIRALDRVHRLGEERAHWLALAAVSLNGRFLTEIVPGTRLVSGPEEALSAWADGRVAVLDAFPFAVADERRPGRLPHLWSATSDSLAARVAVASGARRLVMLKSVCLPPSTDWQEAGRHGLVDSQFSGILAQLPRLEVVWLNLREAR